MNSGEPLEYAQARQDRRRIFFMVSHSSAGGAQEIWVNLAEQFLARGYDVRLLALYPLRKDIRKTSDNLPWHYVVPRQPRNPWDLVKLFVSLVRMLRKEKPEFVLTALPAANVIGAAAASLSGAGVSVITSHHSPASTYSRMLDFVEGFTGSLRSVAGIVCVSDFVKSSLSGKPKRYVAKMRTIKNALPPNIEAALQALREQGKTGRGRNVIATGRLAYQKNYPVLLRAAAHLTDAKITIVGSGPDEEELLRLARELKVEDRVNFLGHVPREHALSVLASGDVFVQPSRFEGHSLALIEAAKLGLPLVVSNVPVQIEGITASDGELCGVAVDLDDHEGLAREIQRLLDDREYRETWCLASKKLASDITFDNTVRAYETIMGQRHG